LNFRFSQSAGEFGHMQERLEAIDTQRYLVTNKRKKKDLNVEHRNLPESENYYEIFHRIFMRYHD